MMFSNNISLFERAEKQVREDSGAGAVAGFSAPMGSSNDVVKKKKLTSEADVNSEEPETFEGEKFKITKSYRGPNKGYSLMINQTVGNGTIFSSNEKIQQILNYIESNF